MSALTITVDIAVPPDDLMAYASEPSHLPEWAPGFACSIAPEGDSWVAQTTNGPVRVRFTPPNADGILDHTIQLPNGTEIINRMRVAPHEIGSQVSFELNQRDDMSDEQFEADADMVRSDLERLKLILED